MTALLYVDDEAPNVNLFRRWFDGELTLRTASSAKQALEIMEHEDIGVVVTDQRMPEMTGIELLATIATRYPNVGVGKELVAREIHGRSPRAERAFLRVNCSAFAEGVLESELFGHEAGAFTGARSTRVGRFEQAHRGSLFLDEIGDIPASLQVKLLRAIQEREIERVGGNKTIRVDIRLIAATHRNLEELVKQGQFRSDLFFRLNVVPLVVPPLRTRPHDLADLAAHFVAHYAQDMGKQLTLTPAALAALTRYDWPGNVRELRNMIERAAALADAVADLTPDDFLFELPTAAAAANVAKDIDAAPNDSIFEEIDRTEADRIRDALRNAGGSKAGAARLLGIARTTLNDRIERLKIR